MVAMNAVVDSLTHSLSLSLSSLQENNKLKAALRGPMEERSEAQKREAEAKKNWERMLKVDCVSCIYLSLSLSLSLSISLSFHGSLQKYENMMSNRAKGK